MDGIKAAKALADAPQHEGWEADDLCERLEDILTGNDAMHPVGCSEWEGRARVAVDMAKDFIRRAQPAPAPQVDKGSSPDADTHRAAETAVVGDGRL